MVLDDPLIDYGVSYLFVCREDRLGWKACLQPNGSSMATDRQLTTFHLAARFFCMNR
jgi:hypothetical protein